MPAPASRRPRAAPAALDRRALGGLVRRTRRVTRALAAPLAVEDQVVQSMPDASPTKWHLAHTSWFFETFVLGPAEPGYRPLDPRFATLFNSYYHAIGPQHARPARGLCSRPTVAEVAAYRAHVDRAVGRWLAEASPGAYAAHRDLVELGVNHEEQHQELLLTDALHLLAQNPLQPAYRPAGAPPRPATDPGPMRWCAAPGGLVELGAGPAGFAYDNERPRHRAHLAPFALADRLVTCAEFLRFIDAGGYTRPEWWLADGWTARQAGGWEAPLYWTRGRDGFSTFTLAGPEPLDPHAPVCHVSYYEAEAFARWAGARLPLEAEWEWFAAQAPIAGTFLESGALAPRPADPGRGDGPAQLFGDAWQWTASPYVPYPGFRPFAGAAAEYNGKFMCNQLVLRGGSCVTPRRHVRATYRNFFPPGARWQFSGIRLARDAG